MSMWVLIASSVVHRCVVETNEDVKIAVCHTEGMRCVKTGSKSVPLFFFLLCVCVCVCVCTVSRDSFGGCTAVTCVLCSLCSSTIVPLTFLSQDQTLDR